MNGNLPVLHIVGGGLAGCEAAWQGLRAGVQVILHEMRPTTMTAAHKTGNLAELVCSNSLKSTLPASAPGLLKAEMNAFDSLILRAAAVASVPAGNALAVEREKFSATISEILGNHPLFSFADGEVTQLPTQTEMEARNECWIIATGPLTSTAMTDVLNDLTGGVKRLHFYDAIAPILETESIDMDKAFKASRYDDAEDVGDYLNLPLTRPEYEAFIAAVKAAAYMPLHGFEETKYFEACLPIEVMVERGPETLRFGPMKPVGLTDPKTGRWPYAAVQLRMENPEGTMYSMVGFQTKMKWPEQKRVFSMIPALANVEFFRFGSVHRNTYVDSPRALAPDLSFKSQPRVFLAGQVTGVEGYTESAGIGQMAALSAIARLQGRTWTPPPKTSMIGALVHYVTFGGLGAFSPMNTNMGLLPPIEKKRGVGKAERKQAQADAAADAFKAWNQAHQDSASTTAPL